MLSALSREPFPYSFQPGDDCPLRDEDKKALACPGAPGLAADGRTDTII